MFNCRIHEKLKITVNKFISTVENSNETEQADEIYFQQNCRFIQISELIENNVTKKRNLNFKVIIELDT